MELYFYVMILVLGFIFVVAIIQIYASILLQQNNEPENPKPETQNAKPEIRNPKPGKLNNWTFNERNLHKALLKGRRSGHLQIMYHGQYWSTGLKIVRPCQ